MTSRECVLKIKYFIIVYRQKASIFLPNGMYVTVRRMFKDPKHLILWLFFSLNDCMSCINDTCVACELGTYQESGSCHLCPEHCTSCYSSEACNYCTDGYFGLSCAFNCSFCINNTCNKDSGVCTGGCIDGYFLSNSSCFQCQPNCKTCAISSNNCVQCRDGNYGTSCEYPCSRCKDGICSNKNCTYGCSDGYFQANGACNLCTIHCRNCSGTFDNCQSCEDGYYGQYCQFPCDRCIPCSQEDGSCPGTMDPPTTATDPTTRLTASITSVARTTTQPSTSVSPQTNATNETSHILTSKESKNYQKSQSVDNTIIIYAAAGGGGGLAFLVLIVVVVVICKKRGSARSHETVAENIDMTENENYISANDVDGIFRKSTDSPSEVNHVVYEENNALYSLPNKTNRPH